MRRLVHLCTPTRRDYPLLSFLSSECEVTGQRRSPDSDPLIKTSRRIHSPPPPTSPLLPPSPPVLDLSPYLDSGSYCRRPGVNINGMTAATLLRNGRSELREALRLMMYGEEILSWAPRRSRTAPENDVPPSLGDVPVHNFFRRRRKKSPLPFAAHRRPTTGWSDEVGSRRFRTVSFQVSGHGVPVQLLRDHIELAGDVLSFASSDSAEAINGNAIQCSFASVGGSRKVEWMQVRRANQSVSVVPWPIDLLFMSSDNYPSGCAGYRLHLLLAVVTRISSMVCRILRDDGRPPRADVPLRPERWIVQMRRGTRYDMGENMVLKSKKLRPIVEIERVGVGRYDGGGYRSLSALKRDGTKGANYAPTMEATCNVRVVLQGAAGIAGGFMTIVFEAAFV